MKQSPSVSQLGSILLTFLKRYHIVIFSLTIVIGVSVSMLMLNELLSRSSDPDASSTTTTTTTTFDQDTIEKIKKFRSSDSEDNNFSLPPGRTNPFRE